MTALTAPVQSSTCVWGQRGTTSAGEPLCAPGSEERQTAETSVALVITDDTVATTTTEYETKDQIVQGANYYLMIADGNVTNCDFAFGFESSIRATRGPSRRWEKRTKAERAF